MLFKMDLEWFAIGAGSIVLLYTVAIFLKIFFNIFVVYVISRPIDLRKRAGASWAVVTGATDGIGKSYCFELAKRGFNVLIISRTVSKLEQTKQEILEKYPDISVQSAVFDFTSSSPDDYKELLRALNEVSIGLLVNNVGMFYEYPEILHLVDGGVEQLANVAVVNMFPPTLLTAGILPQMVARRAGIIINIGSASGMLPMAKWAVYSASKKYVNWLTAILQKEYASHGIIFQVINPMRVSTKMSGSPRTSFFCPDSAAFAKSALNTVGHVSQTTGYITHQIEEEAMNFAPAFILNKAVDQSSDQLREEYFSKMKSNLS